MVSKQLHNLWIHDDRFSKQEVVINPDIFPHVRVGDLLEIFHPLPNGVIDEDDEDNDDEEEGGREEQETNSELRKSRKNRRRRRKRKDASRDTQQFGTSVGSRSYLTTSSTDDEDGDLSEDNNNNIEKRHRQTSIASLSKKLIVQVTQIDRSMISKQPQLQISIASHIASSFELQARTNVVVQKVDPQSVSADFIELTFRDQYIGRSDMWRLKMSVNKTCVYSGKKLNLANVVRAVVKDVVVRGQSVRCGYITETTKTIFRSESAKYFIYIQMSREMWEFDEDGELYFEKCVHGVLPELFHRWKETGTNHVVSIVLFSRVFFPPPSSPSSSAPNASDVHDPALRSDQYGRFYKDFYRVVIDWETRSDWSSVLIPLKKEFVAFQREVLCRKEPDGSFVLCGENSSAQEGNVLEAVNLALNPFDKHYIDRDLLRTGLAIVVITPGSGMFEADKHLLRLTTHRMVDNGIGLDLISLSKPPLYMVPLFQFTGYDNTNNMDTMDTSSLDKKPHGKLTDKKVLEIVDPLYTDNVNGPDAVFKRYNALPNWSECSFWSRSTTGGSESELVVQDNRFVPRAKMYEVQMMGVVDQTDTTIVMPYFDSESWNNEASGEIGSSNGASGSHMWENVDSTLDAHDRATFQHGRQNHGNSRNYPMLNMETLSGDAPSVGRSRMASSSHPTESNFYHLNAPSPKESSNRLSGYGSYNDDGAPIHSQVRFAQDLNNPINNAMSSSAPIRINRAARPSASEYRSSYNKDHDDFYRGSKNSLSGSEMVYRSINPNSSPTSYAGKSSPNKHLFGPLSFKPHYHHQQSKQYYVNPCNPVKNVLHGGSHFKRWLHIFGKTMSPSSSQAIMKWKPLSTPACLPLTTEFFPTSEELALLYQEYTYTVSPNEEVNVYQDSSLNERKKIENLLIELISQRLAQGFQLIVSHGLKDAEKMVGGNTTAGMLQPVESVDFSTTATTAANTLNANTTTATSEQRLAPENDSTDATINSVSLPTFSITKPYYLSLGDHVHRLFYDASGQNVEVKRYVRKIRYNTEPLPYTCCIWPKHLDGYYPRSISFSYPSFGNYNWNYLDHLISGYQDDMPDSLRFWRTRFLLIPMDSIPQSNMILNPSNEILDQEELRMAGFYKFMEAVEKARWIPANERHDYEHKKAKELRAGNIFGVSFTTLGTSAFINNEALKNPEAMQQSTASVSALGALRRSSILGDKLTKTSNYNAIAAAMQAPTGVPLRDRRWHFRLYESSFVGSECVEWMVRAFSDIDTREEAVAFGNELLSKGFFEHVNQKHSFLDGYYFYRLQWQSAPREKDRGAMGWFRASNAPALSSGASISSIATTSTTASNATANTSNLSSNSANTPAVTASSSAEINAPPSGRITPSIGSPSTTATNSRFELSRRLVIDMDSQKRSTRKEMAILHYDTVYNPRNCYHFQLHWLVCTARLIEDLLQSWARLAEKCGVKLVEAPVEQAKPFSDDNPFQSIVSIPLSVPPPSTADLEESSTPLVIPPFYYETELLRHLGFVLDVESDDLFPADRVTYSFNKASYKFTQFVHRSGVAFVQVCGDGQGFLWVNNRLYLTSTGSGISSLAKGNRDVPNPDVIRQEFVNVCADKEFLEKIWQEAKERLATLVQVQQLDD